MTAQKLALLSEKLRNFRKQEVISFGLKFSLIHPMALWSPRSKILFRIKTRFVSRLIWSKFTSQKSFLKNKGGFDDEPMIISLAQPLEITKIVFSIFFFRDVLDDGRVRFYS